MKSPTLKAAIIGIGGFGGSHHTAFRELEESGLVKVVATCDPRSELLQERQCKHDFPGRGVAVYRDFDSLLEAHGQELDLVSVASPIRYHAEHHQACVERQIPCYLEKPPSLDPDELESMIAVESQARYSTQVGFNNIGQSWRQELKKRLVAGDFGAVRRVGFKGLARRSLAYYARNSWAGRLKLGDYLCLDSCCGNAMAHYVHNLLFHAGTESQMAWSSVKSVEAELYRANAIEGADTIFARGLLHNGVEFHISSTHACKPDFQLTEFIECESASIEIPEKGPGSIAWSDGRNEPLDTTGSLSLALLKDNLERYCHYLLGRAPRPMTVLSDAQSFVALNALLYIAAKKIQTIQPSYLVHSRVGKEDHETIRISGIESVCDEFSRTRRFPSQTAVKWATKYGRANVEELSQLGTAIKQILETEEENSPLALAETRI